MQKPKLDDSNRPKAMVGGINIELMRDFDRFSSGSMFMKLADTHMEVAEDGKNVGNIGMAIGGSLYVGFKNRTWRVSVEDIFRQVLSRDKEYVEANPVPPTGEPREG